MHMSAGDVSRPPVFGENTRQGEARVFLSSFFPFFFFFDLFDFAVK
jgi:hypothetical protein